MRASLVTTVRLRGASARPVSQRTRYTIVGVLCLAIVFAWVASASAVRVAPAPSRVSVTAGDMSNTIAWRPPRGYRTFRVYRATSAEGPFVCVTPRAVARNAHEDRVAQPGTYYYYVIGVNGRRVTASSTVAANERVAMREIVGPAGATLRAANGAVTLALPAGALSATTPITVNGPIAKAEVPGGIRTAPVFDLGPDGTKLATAGTLTMRYAVPVSHFQVALTLERATDLATYDEARSRWTTSAASADTTAGVFSGQLSHFSYWTGAVVQPHGSTPSKISYCSGVCHQLTDAPGSMAVIPSRSKTVCYNCHGNTSAVLGPAGAAGPNIQAEFLDAPGQSFTATSSRHPVAEGKLNCTSCHDPHVDPAASYKNLRAYDAVTGRAIRSNATTSNVGNEYCWACHGTVKNRRIDALDPGYWARTGDRKTGFAGTAHDTKVTAPTASGIRCLGCHTDHGAANGSLIATSVAGNAVTGNDKTLCLGCHGAALGAYTGSGDYATNPHSAVTTSTKALGTAPGTSAKAGDCQNCHDPHGVAGLESYLRASEKTLCPSCHDAFGLSYPDGYGYRGPDVFAASGHGGITSQQPRTKYAGPGSAGFAAWESTARPTPTAPGTPIPVSRIAGLASMDSTVTITKISRSTGESDYQMYRFKPDVALAEVRRLKVAWRGWGEELATYPVSVYLWNRTRNGGAGDWEAFASRPMAQVTSVATATADFAPYVDGEGYVWVLAEAPNVNDAEILSGPTVIGATATQMRVRWQTRGLTDSWVDVGTTTAYGSTYGTAARTQNHDVLVPLPGGNLYHFRVRSTASDGERYTSPDYTLAVPAPTLTDIYGIYGTTGTVTYNWACPAPAREPFTYRLTVWSDQGYSYDSGWIATRTVGPVTLGEGSYTWQVEARDAGGNSFGMSQDAFFIWPPSNSCPFLFVWDGERFAFEADLNTTGKLGEKNSTGYVKPDPRDRYVLTTPPALKDGKLEMRLVEERTEVDYTDEFKIYAAEVPEGVGVVAEKGDRGRRLGVPPAGLHTVTDLHAPVAATRLDTGEDVRAALAKADGDLVELNEDANVGFDFKTLELDLGEEAEAAPQVKIVMTAATDRPTTPEGIARQRTYPVTTKLEVQDRDGTWRSVPASEASLPNAMEMARQYVFDITGAMHDTTGRVRFTFLFKTYIDQLNVDLSADEPITLREVPMTSAELRQHGIDDREGAGPMAGFEYGRLIAGYGRYFPGRYTRFGDVTPLLAATDDKFVIYGQGDELVLRFDPLPEAPAGVSRTYVAFIDGFYKGTKSAVPSQIDPLPFAAMSNYPYPDGESYPADADHAEYRATYNTREYDASGTLVPSAVPAFTVRELLDGVREALAGVVRAIAGAFAPVPAEERLATAPLHRSLNTDNVGLELELEPTFSDAACTACHAVHGGSDWDGRKLTGLRAAPDGNTCTGNGGGSCHSLPATGAAGLNIHAKVTEAPDDRTAHHDVLPAQQALSGSRVACGDCHNPHSDDATSTWSDVDDRSKRGKSDFAKYFDGQGRMLVMIAARHDGMAPVLTGTTVDIDAAGPLSPVVRWTTDEMASTWVDYGTTPAYELGSVGSATPSASHAATLTGLAYGSTYYFRVRSTDALGNQASGGQQIYQPVPTPSAPVLSPIASFGRAIGSLGPGSVTVTWTPVASTDGGAVEYEAQLVNITSSGWTAATSWTTPNILYAGAYQARVRVRNVLHPLAISAWSNVATFTVTNTSPPPPASCPDLFTWDGSRFAFVTDVMNNAPIGVRIPSGGYLFPRPYEETRIDPSLLKPKDGRYELRMRDNNDEIEYVDRVALKVVDHPKGTKVYTDDLRYSSTTGTVPPQRLFTVRDPKPVRSAAYTNIPLFRGPAVDAMDVTDALADVDGVYAPAYIYDDNRYTFDLGDLRDAKAIKLVMTGWTQYSVGDEGKEFRASGAKAAEQVLEVQGADGRWIRVQDPAGFIPGYAKTVVYDLTGKFPPRVTDYRVRLRGLIRTHIDQVLVDTSPNEPVTVREVSPVSAVLSVAGVSPMTTTPAPSADYESRRGGDVQLNVGMFTRLGDVLPLTTVTDDKFVVMDTGDELALSFPAPAADPETDRTCLIAADGYFQQTTDQVDPMPFHAMSTWPYGADERYPTDVEHGSYRAEWNTRRHTGEIVPASGEGQKTVAALKAAPRVKRLKAGRKQWSPFETVLQGFTTWRQLVTVPSATPLFAPIRTMAEEPPSLSANTDAVWLRVSRVDDAVTTYTASAGWESAGTTMAVPSASAPGSPAGAATLAKVASVDTTYWTTSLTTADSEYNRQVFAFDVPDAKRQVTKDVFIGWRGHGEPTPGYDNVPVYLWNYETSGWDKLAEARAASDATIAKPIEGVPSAYCLECHDGTPRQGVVLAGIVNVGAAWGAAPATADRHGDRAGTGAYGYGGWAWQTSGSLKPGYSRGSLGIGCVTCHDPHGNSNPYHLQTTVNGSTGLRIREQGSATFCKSCHVGTVRQFHEPCAVQCHYGEVDHYEDITYLLPDESSDCLSCHKHGKGWGHTPGCGHEGCQSDNYYYPTSF